ncbi:MAG: phenylpyruvate tautomerase MIF-related protein [Verrucomicrobiota bacterium]
MPYLSITTNAPLSQDAEAALAAAVSKSLAAEMGKPEAYVMVSVHPVQTLYFGGSDAPAAFLDIKSIGLPDQLNTLAAALTELVAQHCRIGGNRVFMNFTDISPAHWAHNGGTFA